MTYKAGDKVKVNGSIQEIENITQWDKDTQRYKFVGVSGWHEIKEPRQEERDLVHRPEHYMQGHIETIDKIKLLLTPEEYLGYLKGNVIKYDRAPFKGNMEQDYDKQKV